MTNSVDSNSNFGVSFIDQDVCGSKYNDDPFTEIDNKKSAWEEFQDRVKAIVDKHNSTGNATAINGQNLLFSLLIQLLTYSLTYSLTYLLTHSLGAGKWP